MGKIKKGILGGFNGRVGNVIGGSWKGVAYMRSEAQSIKNPRTENQQENRTMFGQVSDLFSKAKSIIDLGFAGEATKKSAFNAAVQENMKAMVEHGAGFETTYLTFAKGNLQPLASGSVSKEGSVVTATFNTYEAVQEVTKVKVVFVIAGSFPGAPLVVGVNGTITANASSGTATYTVPAGLTYESIDVFAFIYDTATNACSNSSYLGNES